METKETKTKCDFCGKLVEINKTVELETDPPCRVCFECADKYDGTEVSE